MYLDQVEFEPTAYLRSIPHKVTIIKPKIIDKYPFFF